MKILIFIAIFFGLANCSIVFANASYGNESQKTVNIVLDEQFRTLMHIDTIGDIHVAFDLNSSITYFTSNDCEDCLFYGQESEITPYQCQPQNNCIKQSDFTGLQIGDYIASGDIIALPMVLDRIIFYLEEVYYVKKLTPTTLNPSTYQSQQIGLLIARDNQKVYDSQIFNSLAKQGKIDKISYSLYYSENNYHLTIPGYDRKLISQYFNDLSLGYSKISEKIIQYDFNASVEFCGKNIVELVSVEINPRVDDTLFSLNENYFNNFKQIIEEQRLLPDLSLFTAQNQSKWSKLIDQFTFSIKLNIDQSGNLPKPKNFEFFYPADQFMMKKSSDSENYYTIRVNFVKDLNRITLGKRILSKMLYYIYYDEQKNIKIALAPLKPKTLLRQTSYN
ncbi:transmembrane protein, putative (macronuclear) [Tetrahymena thermophila SB210]|uniref:Transmembrane protein, putative n=1 Tax=Tetrahymena thermophila (strain SB210) TaxID=312017 RepID=Q23B05_TETTS|nr:transmembrane protein, putative [Tetrahymena thermophila SB210]EAR93679.1 transmembrane protein, putative [Tetrahymena thermophila SB210]|eukprot:XP_001013924.1 transmembrane protein, putative [Tetrahymena thermophila SB210]